MTAESKTTSIFSPRDQSQPTAKQLKREIHISLRFNYDEPEEQLRSNTRCACKTSSYSAFHCLIATSEARHTINPYHNWATTDILENRFHRSSRNKKKKNRPYKFQRVNLQVVLLAFGSLLPCYIKSQASMNDAVNHFFSFFQVSRHIISKTK